MLGVVFMSIIVFLYKCYFLLCIFVYRLELWWRYFWEREFGCIFNVMLLEWCLDYFKIIENIYEEILVSSMFIYVINVVYVIVYVLDVIFRCEFFLVS